MAGTSMVSTTDFGIWERLKAWFHHIRLLLSFDANSKLFHDASGSTRKIAKPPRHGGRVWITSGGLRVNSSDIQTLFCKEDLGY